MPTKLGQNFLVNEKIAKKIVNSAEIQGINVLEIGPGKGVLTKYLVERVKKVLVVEIDDKLAESLLKKFAEFSIRHSCESEANKEKISVINADILKINLPELIKEKNFLPYKVVANLPYYITSKIIRLLLETKYPPTEMILMVQKEVGERIVAADGKESLLSISVKFYAKPEILFIVSRDNFDPVPKVDSAVIKITRKKKMLDIDIKKFFSLVRAGFSSKRKTLANNLSASFHIPKADFSKIFKKAKLEPKIRAEKLKLEDWIKLYHNFEFEY